MKQTAVEFLIEQIIKEKGLVDLDIQAALEMEKQQIIDAYKKGYMFGMQNRNPKSEEYYNETYKPSA
jgi:hypothetical protein